MKKLLVLALSAVMVLAMAAVSMASVTVSGEVVAIYNFEGAPASDKAEGKIVFDGKVNDNVTAKVVYKYAQNGMDSGIDTNDDGIVEDLVQVDEELFVDEYWFNVNGDLGSLKVGKFGQNSKGSVDLLDPATKDMKAEAGMLYTYSADALTFKMFYAADAANYDVNLEDNAVLLQLGYAGETFGGDINVINSQVDTDETAYSVNLWVKPMDSLKAYAYIGSGLQEQEATILGALYTGMDGALNLRGEFGTWETAAGVETDGWGISGEYAAANGLKYKYTRKSIESNVTTSEFKVTVGF